MKQFFRIRLDLKDVPEFISASNSIPKEVCVCQGTTVASGKSVLGMYSIDWSRPANLIVRDRDNDDIVYEKFGKWIVEEY